MAVKPQPGPARALIEVWREGDRVLIGVPSADHSTSGAHGEGLGYGDSWATYDPIEMNEGRLSEVPAAPEPRGSAQANVERTEAEIFAMNDQEWLVADLLALRRQAVDLCRSLEETRAYVAEKCASIEKN